MNENLNMSVSEIISKDGEKKVYVEFSDADRTAEGSLPEGKIIKNKGFSEEEVAALELYMQAKSEDIFQMAKGVNGLKAFFGK